MELYIFDKNLNRLGLIDKYESLIWNRKCNEVGIFELHCNVEYDTLRYLKKDNIIFKSNDLTEGAYIENVYIDEDSKGIETIKVIGKFISGYIGNRIVWRQETINDTVENAIRRLVNNNCINTSEDRKIPYMQLGELKNYADKIDYQVSYKNLEEEVCKISKEKDINFRIVTDLENKIHKFDIYKGVDRTVNQNINPRCSFSREFENNDSQSYSYESDNVKNIALVAGEGEGSNRTLTIIGDSTGLDRKEIYVDARDIRITREDETSIPQEEYLKLLTQRGLEKLSQFKEIINFDAKVNVTNSNLVYKEDFNLGDYVSCINKKWGMILNVKITEIEEVYEKNKYKINIVFGDRIPTLIDKVKRR